MHKIVLFVLSYLPELVESDSGDSADSYSLSLPWNGSLPELLELIFTTTKKSNIK